MNREKTHIGHASEGIKFLGVIIYSGYTQIQDKKIEGFKEKVRKITRRNLPVNLEKVIKDLNPVFLFWGKEGESTGAICETRTYGSGRRMRDGSLPSFTLLEMSIFRREEED